MTEPTPDAATFDEPLPRFHAGWLDAEDFPVTETTENARAQSAHEDALLARRDWDERDRLEDEAEARDLRLRLAGVEPRSLAEVFGLADRRARISDAQAAAWERNALDEPRAASDLSDLRAEARLKAPRVAKQAEEAEEAGRLALEPARKRRDARHTARREASGRPSLVESASAWVRALGGRR